VNRLRFHGWRWLVSLVVAALLAGCASRPPLQANENPAQTADSQLWQGRLAIKVHTTPVQATQANFALQGSSEAGELQLSGPLGSAAALIRWTPLEATVKQGGGERSYPNLAALVQDLTHTDIPVAALFAWLQGTPEAVDNWQADLTRLEEGRLTARKLAPAPSAEIILLLDR
jgi:outer membrane lipoprotein LolB